MGAVLIAGSCNMFYGPVQRDEDGVVQEHRLSMHLISDSSLLVLRLRHELNRIAQ